MALFVAAHSAIEPMAFWYHLNLPAWMVFSIPGFTLGETQMRLPDA